jgi:hypothetical protein
VELRVEILDEDMGGSHIRIDGRLAGDGVPELLEACEGIEPPSTVDLTHLISADESGLEVLRSWWENGAKLFGVSPYIALRLGLTDNGAGSSPAASEEREA